MKFSNEILESMDKKQKQNSKIAYFFKLMSEEYADEKMFHKVIQRKPNHQYVNNKVALESCMKYWQWDKYNENKILDLQIVNRCKSKFCSNCRAWDLGIVRNNFKSAHEEMLKLGYTAYMLTLTVPNVEGFELNTTLDKLQLTFKMFIRKFSEKYKRDYIDFRMFDCEAAIRILEITINKYNTYHPHYHCVLYICNECPFDFEKNIKGAYRKKSNDNIMMSYADLHVSFLWYMCCNKINCSKLNYDKLSDDFEEYYVKWQQGIFDYPSSTWCGIYMCDIRKLDEHGVYEVLKYTFKDVQIRTYEQFKTLYFALYKRRVRQTYGDLYHLDIEKDTGEKQSLEEYLKIVESPSKLVVKKIQSLYTVYHDYTKISRFKANNELEDLYNGE